MTQLPLVDEQIVAWDRDVAPFLRTTNICAAEWTRATFWIDGVHDDAFCRALRVHYSGRDSITRIPMNDEGEERGRTHADTFFWALGRFYMMDLELPLFQNGDLRYLPDDTVHSRYFES